MLILCIKSKSTRSILYVTLYGNLGDTILDKKKKGIGSPKSFKF